MMVVVIFLAVFAQATEAAAPEDCVAPTPPAVIRLVKPTKPTPPACVDEARSRHTCRAPVINAYTAQMDAAAKAFTDYVAKLNNYTADLSEYSTAASSYALCERRRVGPEGLIVF